MLKKIIFAILCLMAQQVFAEEKYGLEFSCENEEAQKKLELNLSKYFKELKINKKHYIIKKNDNAINIFLKNKELVTLNLKYDFGLKNDRYKIIGENYKEKIIYTVSKKEIALALLSNGRLSKIKNCNIDSLKEDIGIRQNIVAWSEDLNWIWPDGDSAFWNSYYWTNGTPNREKTVDAFLNVFVEPKKYSFGCYTAAKIVMVNGYLDYFKRVSPSDEKLKKVIDALWKNGDPLVGVEPNYMWKFESDYDQNEKDVDGKIISLIYNVKPKNFIPGDWAYILNTDPVSYNKTGYEGSNAIYLGRNKFDDFYNDTYKRNGYTYEQKIEEVYQWRNGVFSRSKDYAKIKYIPEKIYKKLHDSPDNGGLVFDYRGIFIAPDDLMPNN